MKGAMEWKSGRGYGNSGYTKGKDVFEFGDYTRITNPMLTSRAVWDRTNKVLEIYVRFRTPWKIDEVRTSKAIKRRFAEMFGTSKVICDVECLNKREKWNYCTNRLAYYAVLKERPDAETILKCRQIAESVAVEDEDEA